MNFFCKLWCSGDLNKNVKINSVNLTERLKLILYIIIESLIERWMIFVISTRIGSFPEEQHEEQHETKPLKKLIFQRISLRFSCGQKTDSGPEEASLSFSES